MNFEKKKRVSVQEVNLEKNSSLMQELLERDKRVTNLQKEIRTLKDEKSEIESINHTYFGLGGGLGTLQNSQYAAKSVYQSQQLYNLRGTLPKCERGARNFSKKKDSLGSSFS